MTLRWCASLAGIVSITSWGIVFAQTRSSSERFFQITAGLGVDAHSDPSIASHINTLAMLPSDQKIGDFVSASEFFISPEIQLNDDWSLGLDYSLLVKSYSVTGAYQWEFSYTTQMPTLILHYLAPGDGYLLKFGGGVGYAFGSFNERFSLTGAEESFTASGISMKIEAIGNTEFDENFWGSIGLDLRWVFAGMLANSSGSSKPPAKLNFFSAGVKFGVTYQLEVVGSKQNEEGNIH